jgi:hypothetical protein
LLEDLQEAADAFDVSDQGRFDQAQEVLGYFEEELDDDWREHTFSSDGEGAQEEASIIEMFDTLDENRE